MKDYLGHLVNTDLFALCISSKYDDHPELLRIKPYTDVFVKYNFPCFNFEKLRRICNLLLYITDGHMNMREDIFNILIEKCVHDSIHPKDEADLEIVLSILIDKNSVPFNNEYAKALSLIHVVTESSKIKLNYIDEAYKDLDNYMSIEVPKIDVNSLIDRLVSSNDGPYDIAHDMRYFAEFVGAYCYYHNLSPEEFGNKIMEKFNNDYDHIIDYCALNGMTDRRGNMSGLSIIDSKYYETILNQLEDGKREIL